MKIGVLIIVAMHFDSLKNNRIMATKLHSKNQTRVELQD